jgi:hypothetical protein
MNAYDKMCSKLGKQTVYLMNSFEGCVMKVQTNGEYLIKFKGRPEYKVLRSTNIACETLLEANEISEDQYKRF